ncbi:hypothetical protein GQ457_15G019720 [Hibiscus cannabinus]
MANTGDQNGTGRDAQKQVWTLFVWNLSNGLHWKGLWQCFYHQGVVVDAFIPVKRAFDGTRFGFVCMASRVDALRAIERLDGFTLYGSQVRVSFAARATRNSFWRRKKGSLPRPSDPPQGVFGAVTAAMGIAESWAVSPRRSVEGIVDDAKLAILQTCVIGWVKEATPIRVLVQEMATSGLQGFELVWVAGSMVLLSFSSVKLQDGLRASTEVWSTWFGRLEAWSQTVAPDSCRAWISISGLPIHLWSEGTFHNIAGLWGSYIRVDAAMEEPSSFERARVLLETSFLGRIDEVVQVTIQGSVYAVVIQEAELVWVPTVKDWDVHGV